MCSGAVSAVRRPLHPLALLPGVVEVASTDVTRRVVFFSPQARVQEGSASELLRFVFFAENICYQSQGQESCCLAEAPRRSPCPRWRGLLTGSSWGSPWRRRPQGFISRVVHCGCNCRLSAGADVASLKRGVFDCSSSTSTRRRPAALSPASTAPMHSPVQLLQLRLQRPLPRHHRSLYLRITSIKSRHSHTSANAAIAFSRTYSHRPARASRHGRRRLQIRAVPLRSLHSDCIM